METAGYIFAIITSVFFTLYTLPRKMSKGSPAVYCAFVGAGFFIASLIAFVLCSVLVRDPGDTLADPVLLLSCLAGVFWFSGSMLLVLAIDKVGLSRSNQWKNIQGPVGAALQLVFLAEYRQTNVWLLIVAVILILVSAWLFTIKNPNERIVDRSGVIYAILSGICFGINALIQKYVSSTGHMFSQMVCMSGAVFLAALIYLQIRERSLLSMREVKNKDNLWGAAAGVLFFCASFFSIMAYRRIPGSVAFTIIQLNAVWTVLAGVLIFREIDFKKHWLRITAGLILAVAAVFVLMTAG